MKRTRQLPVGEFLVLCGGGALFLCAVALPLTPVSGWAFHEMGHIPPTGYCRDCPENKGTGETSGSNVPRDSKTKAPSDTKAKAPDCDGMRQEVKNLCNAAAASNCTGDCQTAYREKIRDASNKWGGSACGQGKGLGCGGDSGGPSPTSGQPSGPGSTAGGGGGSSGGGSGGGGGGFGGGKGGGSGGGGPLKDGGKPFFMIPAKDLQGKGQDNGGKGIGKWLPWQRGNKEPSQRGPGAIGPGSLRENIAPLPKERLPEVLAALDQFGSASQGNANLPALNSILTSARKESEPNRQAEILKAVLPLLLASLRDPDSLVRRGAANVLGKMGQAATPAIPPLMEKLADQDETVRKAAAGALKEIGHDIAKTAPRENDPKRQAEINNASAGVQNSDAAIRRQSAEKLGTMGRQARPAIPTLVDRLQDPDAAVRNAAADALKKIARSFETQDGAGSEPRRAALCMDLSWTGFQISAFSCDLAAR